MARIRPGTLTVVILAVLSCLATAYGFRKYLEQPEIPVQAAVPEPEVRYIPVASTHLAPGKTLMRGDIAMVPSSNVGELPAMTMLSTRDIIGRILREPVAAGDHFSVASLYPEGTGPNLAEQLRPGLRAVSVPIRASGAVDGFAKPGSMVDVLFRATPRKLSENRRIPEATMTLLENVEVLALGTSSNSASRDRFKSVTLAVAPAQANVLKVVEGRGELSLLLRSPEETVPTALTPNKSTLEDVLGIEEEKAAPTFQAEIYRGTARHSLSFQRDRVLDEAFGGPTQYTSHTKKDQEPVAEAADRVEPETNPNPEG